MFFIKLKTVLSLIVVHVAYNTLCYLPHTCTHTYCTHTNYYMFDSITVYTKHLKLKLLMTLKSFQVKQPNNYRIFHEST